MPDWQHVLREPRKPVVTLFLFWETYRKAHPKGHGNSRFSNLYQRFDGKLGFRMSPS